MKKILIFLLILVLLTEPLFLFWTFVHEFGHKHAFQRESIAASIDIHLFHLPHGVTKPITKDGCEQFNALGPFQKTLIYYGGTRYDLVSIVLVFFFSIVFGALAFNRKIMPWWVLFGLCIVSLIILFCSIASNTNPFTIGSDFFGMMNNIPLDCHKIFG